MNVGHSKSTNYEVQRLSGKTNTSQGRQEISEAEVRLHDTYSTVRIGNYQSDKFPIQNGLKQGDALSRLLFSFALEYAIRRV
jgi:hypothetical protein